MKHLLKTCLDVFEKRVVDTSSKLFHFGYWNFVEHLFGSFFENLGDNLILDEITLNITLQKTQKIMTYKKQDRPMCGCGNTQDPNGYCDGSHTKN